MSKDIVIPLSKGKLFIMLVLAIGFVALGVWLIMHHSEMRSLRYHPVTIFLAGIASILFFGLISISLAKKLTDKKPGLIISDDGITDNASGVSAGFIPWENITGLNEVQIKGQKVLMICVKNPKEYINRQPNFMKRKAASMNYKYFGSPISISANGLKINFSNLKKMLDERWSDYKMLLKD